MSDETDWPECHPYKTALYQREAEISHRNADVFMQRGDMKRAVMCQMSSRRWSSIALEKLRRELHAPYAIDDEGDEE